MSAKLSINDNPKGDCKIGKNVWSGTQCENARKQYHSAKSKHSRNPTHCSKSNLVQASKYYKKKMNYYINKHNKTTKTKSRNLKSKNPKEYWKVINSIDNKKVDSNIELDSLYSFFSMTLMQNLISKATRQLII